MWGIIWHIMKTLHCITLSTFLSFNQSRSIMKTMLNKFMLTVDLLNRFATVKCFVFQQIVPYILCMQCSVIMFKVWRIIVELLENFVWSLYCSSDNHLTLLVCRPASSWFTFSCHCLKSQAYTWYQCRQLTVVFSTMVYILYCSCTPSTVPELLEMITSINCHITWPDIIAMGSVTIWVGIDYFNGRNGVKCKYNHLE